MKIHKVDWANDMSTFLMVPLLLQVVYWKHPSDKLCKNNLCNVFLTCKFLSFLCLCLLVYLFMERGISTEIFWSSLQSFSHLGVSDIQPMGWIEPMEQYDLIHWSLDQSHVPAPLHVTQWAGTGYALHAAPCWTQSQRAVPFTGPVLHALSAASPAPWCCYEAEPSATCSTGGLVQGLHVVPWTTPLCCVHCWV